MSPIRVNRTTFRLALTVASAAAAAMVSAIGIALADLYLVGHDRAGLLRDWISWPAAGVFLSAGDLILFGLAILAAALTWNLSGRRS